MGAPEAFRGPPEQLTTKPRADAPITTAARFRNTGIVVAPNMPHTLFLNYTTPLRDARRRCLEEQ